MRSTVLPEWCKLPARFTCYETLGSPSHAVLGLYVGIRTGAVDHGMSMRREVLAVYKRALRLANDWGKYALQPEDVLTEKEYIRSESKNLFHKNRYISDDEMIKDHIKEAETRIEMAIHYKTPYPRPVNIPQSVLPPLSAKLKKGQRRSIKQSKPIYLKSYDDIET